MSTPEIPNQFFRINRRCIALMNIAKLGQHGAEGINLARSVGINSLTRLMIGDGLEFTRHLEIDLETFQDGKFELRPGLESCNITRVMANVFHLKDPNLDSELLEQTWRDLKSCKLVLTSLGAGDIPPSNLFDSAFNFLKSKGDGYEDVANKATEEFLYQKGI